MNDFSAGYSSGYGKGLLEDIQSRRAHRANMASIAIQKEGMNLAKQEMGMKQQEFANKQFDIEKQRIIDSELAKAMKMGGYGAAIEYLKTADPKQALMFQEEKLKLDDHIMQNDVLQTVAPIQKQEAMLTAYGHLGKLAAGIESLPEDQRSQALAMVHPMFEKIAPGAVSKKYDDKTSVALKLFIAQGTPENVLFQTKQNALEMQSNTGKLAEDLIKAQIKYGNDSIQANSIRSQLDNDVTQSKLDLLKASQMMIKDKQSGEDKLRDDWRKDTQNFQIIQDNYQKIAKLATDPGKDINRGVYDMSLIFGYMKMLDPTSTVREGEYANAENTRGVPDTVRMLYNKAQAGEKLTDKQRQSFVQATKDIYNTNVKSYDRLKGEYLKVVNERGYSPSTLVEKKQTEEDVYKEVVGKLPPDMQEQAQAAIEQTKGDPKKLEIVMKNIQQFLQQGK